MGPAVSFMGAQRLWAAGASWTSMIVGRGHRAVHLASNNSYASQLLCQVVQLDSAGKSSWSLIFGFWLLLHLISRSLKGDICNLPCCYLAQACHFHDNLAKLHDPPYITQHVVCCPSQKIQKCRDGTLLLSLIGKQSPNGWHAGINWNWTWVDKAVHHNICHLLQSVWNLKLPPPFSLLGPTFNA
jgi:hypothetical protein